MFFFEAKYYVFHIPSNTLVRISRTQIKKPFSKINDNLRHIQTKIDSRKKTFIKQQTITSIALNIIQKCNLNHFGFGDIRITENAQFTEYPEGGFYDWHMDCDVNMAHEPPVRKISMTLLLNDPSEFEGGDLELMAPGKFAKLKQGYAIIFASFLNHRVAPVTRGVRQSLVVWFGGKPFR